MSNPRIAFYNHFADMAWTASSAATGQNLGLAHAFNERRDQAWRNTGGVGSAATLSGSFADDTSRTLAFIGMIHRMHGANVRIQVYSDNAYTTSVLDVGGAPGTAIASSIALSAGWGLKSGYQRTTDLMYFEQDFAYWLTTPLAYKSIKFTFSGTPVDDTNTARTFFEVINLFGGPAFEFDQPFEVGATLGVSDNSIVTQDGGGGIQVSRGYQKREFEATFSAMTPNDRRALLDVCRFNGLWRFCWFSAFPGAGTRDERDYTMPCRIKTMGAQSWQLADRSQRLMFREA
jgi:hypothetical protein